MCGRFSITVSVEELEKRFDVISPIEYRPRYNAAPDQPLPVIVNDNPTDARMLRWGLIPHWSKEPKGFINARAETIAERASFKTSFQKRRCIIPADGFYEWDRSGTEKVPYRFTLKDGSLFAFAGIWDEWTNPEGKKVRTFAIITTQANGLVRKIHDRMPVILEREKEKMWLEKAVLHVLVPYPSGQMRGFRVSRAVNMVANDTPDVIRPNDQTTLF